MEDIFVLCSECSWLQETSHHPTAIDKIRQLETPKLRSEPELETVYDHPTFTKHLNNIELTEKGTAVFECQVEPSKDPSLTIGKIRLFSPGFSLNFYLNDRLGAQ